MSMKYNNDSAVEGWETKNTPKIKLKKNSKKLNKTVLICLPPHRTSLSDSKPENKSGGLYGGLGLL